jgi:hypothetical protein
VTVKIICGFCDSRQHQYINTPPQSSTRPHVRTAYIYTSIRHTTSSHHCIKTSTSIGCPRDRWNCDEWVSMRMLLAAVGDGVTVFVLVLGTEILSRAADLPLPVRDSELNPLLSGVDDLPSEEFELDPVMPEDLGIDVRTVDHRALHHHIFVSIRHHATPSFLFPSLCSITTPSFMHVSPHLRSCSTKTPRAHLPSYLRAYSITTSPCLLPTAPPNLRATRLCVATPSSPLFRPTFAPRPT